MQWMYKSRYTRHLEAENERLRAELERATLERQAAINAMLAQMGAPTLDLDRSKPSFPEQRKRNIPSVFRRMQESLSRKAVDITQGKSQ